MKTIKLLKNGKTIKTFKCHSDRMQKWFTYVYNIAGGMHNGKDEFKVIILKD